MMTTQSPRRQSMWHPVDGMLTLQPGASVYWYKFTSDIHFVFLSTSMHFQDMYSVLGEML